MSRKDIESTETYITLPAGTAGLKFTKTDSPPVIIAFINPTRCPVRAHLDVGDEIVGFVSSIGEEIRDLNTTNLISLLREDAGEEGRQLIINRVGSATLPVVAAAPVPNSHPKNLEEATHNVIENIQHPNPQMFINQEQRKGFCGCSPLCLSIMAVMFLLFGIAFIIVAVIYGPLAVTASAANTANTFANGGFDYDESNADDVLDLADTSTSFWAYVWVIPLFFALGIISLILSCVMCCCLCANSAGRASNPPRTTIQYVHSGSHSSGQSPSNHAQSHQHSNKNKLYDDSGNTTSMVA